MTPGVKALLIANIAVYVLVFLAPRLTIFLGLAPAAVFGSLWVWQPLTYMFVHRDLIHILFNMLALWMIGIDLERTWGTTKLVKYCLVTGIGAGVTTLLVSLLPLALSGPVYYSVTIGFSGAVYGLLLAFALYFPNRPMMFFPIPIPVPAKYFVLILGAIAFFSSIGASSSGVAHATHLGGLLVGWIYLSTNRPGGLSGEIKYRWTKWRMAQARKRFEVVHGRRPGGWNDRVH
jgi:membrane associated rhomboid family serine protease